MAAKIDKLTSRREAYQRHLADQMSKREQGMLNAPLMDADKYVSTPTPMVFPTRPRPRKQQDVRIETVYIERGGSFVNGFLVGCTFCTALGIGLFVAIRAAGL